MKALPTWLLDVSSGSVHVVDDCVYDVLSRMNEGKMQKRQRRLAVNMPERDITEAREEIQELTDNGMLFTKDIYENAIDQFSNRPTVVKSTLPPTFAHDCNLCLSLLLRRRGRVPRKTCIDVPGSRQKRLIS